MNPIRLITEWWIEWRSSQSQIKSSFILVVTSAPTWGGRSCARTIGLDKSVHFRSRTEHKKCPIVCRGWLSGRAAASDRPTKPGAVGIHHHVTAHFSLETANSTFGMKNCSFEPQMRSFFYEKPLRDWTSFFAVLIEQLTKKSDNKFQNELKVCGVCIGDLGIILFKRNGFVGSFSTYIEHAYPTYALYAYM